MKYFDIFDITFIISKLINRGKVSLKRSCNEQLLSAFGGDSMGFEGSIQKKCKVAAFVSIMQTEEKYKFLVKYISAPKQTSEQVVL